MLGTALPARPLESDVKGVASLPFACAETLVIVGFQPCNGV
jgi:hypothetical protein